MPPPAICAERPCSFSSSPFFCFRLPPRAALFSFEDRPRSFRDADWSSIGTLPKASAFPEARVLVLSGRTGGWKGVIAVHSWIVFKRENATTWTRYDVVGWGNPVRLNGWAPDARWYGTPPTVVADITRRGGAGADPEDRAGRARLDTPMPAITGCSRARTATLLSPRSCAPCRR